jgi:hypothetical protein
MSLVFEDPPGVNGETALRYRERSPERKEMDSLLEQLIPHPDRWARVYDSNDKDDAEKKAGKFRNAAQGLGTGKGWSVTVRQTPNGYSVFVKMASAPPRKRTVKPKADKDAETQNEVADSPQVREPSFQ